MGAPSMHPFFGNQYTDGGYIRGTFTYDAVKGIASLAGEAVKGAARTYAQETTAGLTPKKAILNTGGKNGLIVAGFAAAVVSAIGFVAYRLLKKRAEGDEETSQSIELHGVGVCEKCGSPLVDSTYIPESDNGNRTAYIRCRECGEKNFARYPDQDDTSTASAAD